MALIIIEFVDEKYAVLIKKGQPNIVRAKVETEDHQKFQATIFACFIVIAYLIRELFNFSNLKEYFLL